MNVTAAEQNCFLKPLRVIKIDHSFVDTGINKQENILVGTVLLKAFPIKLKAEKYRHIR